MSGIAGLRGTAPASWATDDRPRNFREMILWRDPNGMAPLTALMSKMGEESSDDPEYAWYEEELKPVRILTAAVATTGQTTLTLDTTADFDALDLVKGDVLLVEKLEVASANYLFEIVEVSADPSASNSLAITRGVSYTSGNSATIATGSYLLKMGSAWGEGSLSPTASSRKSTKLSNYLQIFKTSYNLTRTALATRFRTGDPLQNDKKRKMFDHATAQEYAFLFGRPHETSDSAGLPKRYTGGLFYYLTQHYNAVTSPTIKIWTTSGVTQEDILDAVYKVFDYGYTGAGNERIGLCGNEFLNSLNKIVLQDSATRINYDGTINYFGMTLEKWRLPQGTIYLRTHPLMNLNTRFSKGCFLINPSGIKYRYLKGRDTKAQDNIQANDADQLKGRDTKALDNIQANDADQLKGQWMGEVGAEFHHLRSMMYLAINQS